MKASLSDFTALTLTFLISLAYWSGNTSVPFHPDESTQIFMSGDVERFMENPANLYWVPARSGDLRQSYRLLDAPVSRNLIGIGRSLMNVPAIRVDWNWSLDWTANESAGALPSAGLLQLARLSVDWLFPISLLLIYLAGKKIAGPGLGIIAILLLASNSLVLLHTRRAMAESGLLFGAIFSLWGLLVTSARPWLTAVPAAIAFSAKQTGAAFLAAPLVVILAQTLRDKRRIFLQSGLFLILFAFLTFFLNPFLWRYPIDAAAAAVSARQELSQRQVNEFRQAIPGMVVDSIPDRLSNLVANLYFTPLQFNEVGNYADQTRQAEANYLANPANTLLRSVAGGSILFFLGLAGIVLAANQVRKKGPAAGRGLVILLMSTLILILTLLLLPLAFQRYVIPLVPLTTLLAAYPLHLFLSFIWKTRKPVLRVPIHQPD